MAILFEFDDGDEAYLTLLQQVNDRGDVVSPRGFKTYELLDVTTVIREPILASPHRVRPSFNTKIAATELVQLLAGVSHLGQLDAASNGRFNRYANDGRLLGAYGPRLFKQLPLAVERLRTDEDSRQAVVNLWRPDELARPSGDVPCTLSLTFRVRRGELGLKVHMRSNDVMMGVPYDWYVFSRVQVAVAEVLGLAPGPYVHHVDSLHLYERDQAAGLAIYQYGRTASRRDDHVSAPAFSLAEVLQLEPEPDATFATWEDVQTHARHVLWHQTPTNWFEQRVAALSQDEVICPRCRYVVPMSELTPPQTAIDWADHWPCDTCRAGSAVDAR